MKLKEEFKEERTEAKKRAEEERERLQEEKRAERERLKAAREVRVRQSEKFFFLSVYSLLTYNMKYSSLSYKDYFVNMSTIIIMKI